MELKEWIRTARTAKGLTQEQLGERVGVTKGNVSGWENGRHQPSYSQLLRISQLTGVPLEHAVSEPPAAYGMSPVLAWEHEDDLPPGEFMLVPRLDVHLSAGDGRDQIEIELSQSSPIAFRSDWVRKQSLRPNKLAAMTASGDSMAPTIFDGDLLVVNTAETDVTDGKVYGLWYDGGERVKRLFRMPGGGLRIKSDNPAYDTIELGSDYGGYVRIIGRVVHRSGVGGL